MKTVKKIFFVLIVLVGLTWLYTSSLFGVNEQSKTYLDLLEKELVRGGYAANYFVISGRRWKLDNYLLSIFGGAAAKSKHLSGQAIDIIVLDVNKDGLRDSKDVDIVYRILDKKIVQNNGGLGTYKKEKGFFNSQMIHFDSREKKARWNR